MAYLDGRAVTPAELQTLALTNYGHFTTMRVEAGRARGLELHLERLVRDCRVVFDAKLDPERVRELVRAALPEGEEAMAVRVTVFDPAVEIGKMGLAAEPKVLVTARPSGGLSGPPLRAKSRRFARDLPEVKSVGLFGALHQRRVAMLAGYGDALFVDGAGAISEGGTWNIGFVRGGEVVWPAADCLPGTAMALLKGLHPHVTEEVTLGRLGEGEFEAAFATNAVIGVRPVAAVDGVELRADHPVVGQLLEAYRDLPGDLV
ncbi:aminotransferase class IV [Kitasatospora sp. McL0602]|uniref:aminotransferase class IV n=1 Tax=Kitasatospora sp. McL0602 TaxID=3439530 RepID=UPI003F8BEA23